MIISRISAILAATTATVMPALAWAQVPPPAAPPTREELDRRTQALPDPNRAPRVEIDGDVERAPCPLADPRFTRISVLIGDVRFDGLEVVSPETLRPAWAEFAGQRVPVATLCEIRDRAATILRRQGYLAAVQVPPQKIDDNGTARFDVLMAKLVRVQVRGDAGRAEGIIERQLAKLQAQPVFNSREAERYLLLVEDIPGYSARLTLRPAGTRPGEVIGEVAITYTPIEIDANIQNLGSREIGRFGGLVRARLNGLTGLADTTTVSYFNTADWDEQHVLQTSHSFRLGNEGLTLGGDFTYAWTRPDVGFNGAFRTRTLIGTLRATYPLQRSQATNLLLSGGLDIANQRVRFGSVPLTEDKLRVLFARLDYDRIDPWSLTSAKGFSAASPRWRYGGSLEVRQGISILGASRPCGAGFVNCQFVSLSKVEADPTAFVVRASAYGEIRPSPLFTFSISPRAQLSSGPLLSFEEFSAGNYTVGRGYDPGTLTGDDAVGVQTEVRFGSASPRTRDAWAFQPFVFFDAAWVWNKDRLFLPYPNDPQHLYSAGGGVRAAWGNRARIDGTLAVPLNRTGLQARRPDVRGLVSLTVKLIPWNQ